MRLHQGGVEADGSAEPLLRIGQFARLVIAATHIRRNPGFGLRRDIISAAGADDGSIEVLDRPHVVLAGVVGLAGVHMGFVELRIGTQRLQVVPQSFFDIDLLAALTEMILPALQKVLLRLGRRLRRRCRRPQHQEESQGCRDGSEALSHGSFSCRRR